MEDLSMKRLAISVAATLLAATAFTADPNKLPPQFVGDWCLDNPLEEPGMYRLGLCLPYQNKEGWLTMRADGFANIGKRCSVIQAAADKNSNYLVKFRCSGGGRTWTRNYWMSLQLSMTETERSP
jgi:hypothetical protein